MSFSKEFTVEDWNTDVNNGEYRALYIGSEEHNVEDPIVQSFLKQQDGSYQLKVTDVIISVTSENDVLLISNTPFEGKIVIK